MSADYSLEMSTGVLTAHDPACDTVRRLALAGEPVITLFECERELDGDVYRHICLRDDDVAA